MSRQGGSVKEKLKSYKRTPGSFIVMLLVLLAAIITFAALLFLIAYILVNGVPYLKPSLFSFTYTSDNASLIDHDSVITSDRSSAWYIFSNLPCGICKTWK